MDTALGMIDEASTDDTHISSQGPICEFYVVGVGASAGGLEALETLFHNMPADCGMAFVVVQHLSPDFESHMAELLARQTNLRIHRVTEGMPIEPNSIYLIPPRKEMIVSDGKLRLTDKDPQRGLTLPIDHFFRSLAQDYGRYAIGIVLSGTGSDGTRGIREIHESGGLVIVQSSETAKFDGMPQSAIQTGMVDLILAPDAIPQALMRFVNESISREQLADEEFATRPREEVQKILKLLRDEYGIDFSHYKPHTVMRRIERRLNLQRYVELEAYVERLRNDPDELNELYRDLLIGVTRFFRDREAFEILEQEIIPELLARSDDDEELRFWIAGCATGEEVYSIAILVHEQLEAAGRPINVKIFATDVHRTSLQFASAGVFNEESLEEVTPDRRSKYFRKKRDGYHVVPQLRQMVVFAAHNVLTDSPFTRLDFVSCRNLLIYFQPAAQRTALTMFHFGLKTGGVLFLGASESPGEIADEFETLNKRWKVYRKRRDVHLTSPLRMPGASAATTIVPVNSPGQKGAKQVSDQRLVAAYDHLLARFLPAGFLIDDAFRLLHVFGRAGEYTELRAGRHSSSLLELIHPDLRTGLSGAVHHAVKERKLVKFTGIRVRHRGSDENLELSVEPLVDHRSSTLTLLVTLEALSPPTAVSSNSDEVSFDVDEMSREHIQTLETELRFTRENLQATIEELETANEELQATNEELVASNEELQSTNEELHSVNEELYTVNAEHQRKILELQQLNDDVDNLLAGSDLAVVFLDRDLQIRKFTPQIARLFHLMPQDVGRPLTGFAHNLSEPRFLEDLTDVCSSQQPLEKEVFDREGRPYFMRVLPYESSTRMSGLVITFVDIGTLKSQQTINDQLSAIVASSGDAIISHDLDGRILSWNPAAEELYGYRSEDVVGTLLFDNIVPESEAAKLRESIERVRKGDSLPAIETVRRDKNGQTLHISLRLSGLRNAHGKIAAISAIDRDVTQQVLETRHRDVEHNVAHVLAEFRTVQEALPPLLECLCSALRFEIAEFWETNEANGEIRCRSVHVSEGASYGRIWRDAALKLSYKSGEGLPGRVIELGKVVTLQSTDEVEEAIQAKRVSHSRLKSAVGVPVYAADRLIGVVTLFATRDWEGDDVVQGLLKSVAERLGHLYLLAVGEERTQRLAEVVELTTDFVGTCDLDFRIQTINSAGRALIGLETHSQVAGRPIAELHPPVVADRIRSEGIPKAMRDGSWRGQTVLLTTAGTEVPVEQTILAHRDSFGTVRYFSTVIRDLRVQKEIETTLQAARLAAESANAAKSTFLAHMSHEVRTPMTAVLGLADLLLESETDTDRRHMLEMIRENGRFLTVILNDILDLSKIEAGRLEMELTDVSPVGLVDEVCSLMELRAKSAGIQLQLEYTSPVPIRIYTDPGRVRQILVNLVGNAIKFTHEGTVTVTVDMTETETGPSLRVVVSDTGCGIAPDKLGEIFQPFIQVSGSAADRVVGAGLGLPISRRLAEALGGCITVQSEVDVGSSFTLILPVDDQHAEQSYEVSKRRCYVGREGLALSEDDHDRLLGRRILVAEDTSSLRFLLKRILEQAGASVVAVEDGAAALVEIDRAQPTADPFDAVVLDMHMPRLDGYRTAQLLRERQFDRPVLAVTASAMQHDRQKCLDAGCNAYISKPIDRHQLIQELVQLLNGLK